MKNLTEDELRLYCHIHNIQQCGCYKCIYEPNLLINPLEQVNIPIWNNSVILQSPPRLFPQPMLPNASELDLGNERQNTADEDDFEGAAPLDPEHSNTDFSMSTDDDDEEYEIFNELEDIPIRISMDEYCNQLKLIKNPPNDGDCSICLQPFQSTQNTLSELVVQSPCSHYFHDKCLRKQLCIIGPPKCPNCRFEIRDNTTSP